MKGGLPKEEQIRSQGIHGNYRGPNSMILAPFLCSVYKYGFELTMPAWILHGWPDWSWSIIGVQGTDINKGCFINKHADRVQLAHCCASWFVKLAHSRVIWKEGLSIESMPLQTGLQSSLWGIFLTDRYRGPSPPWGVLSLSSDPGVFKKVAWVSQQAALLHGLCFSSCFAFFDDGL